MSIKSSIRKIKKRIGADPLRDAVQDSGHIEDGQRLRRRTTKANAKVNGASARPAKKDQRSNAMRSLQPQRSCDQHERDGEHGEWDDVGVSRAHADASLNSPQGLAFGRSLCCPLSCTIRALPQRDARRRPARDGCPVGRLRHLEVVPANCQSNFIQPSSGPL
jgi:hypothetical protein